MAEEWALRPGRWNAVRYWIRTQARFGTYHRWIAPMIGWPKIDRKRPVETR
jgi:hypothetical protein